MVVVCFFNFYFNNRLNVIVTGFNVTNAGIYGNSYFNVLVALRQNLERNPRQRDGPIL